MWESGLPLRLLICISTVAEFPGLSFAGKIFKPKFNDDVVGFSTFNSFFLFFIFFYWLNLEK